MRLKPDYKKRILSLISDEELKEVLKSLVDHFEYSIEDIESLSELTGKEKELLSEKVLNNVVGLKKFFYYYDEKVTIWRRNHFSIEAESQEEADAMAIEYMIEPRGIEVDEGDYLYETEEGISPENNEGNSTIELYSKEDHSRLYENGE